MKALSIKQPWVHAILYEGKDIENRSWQRSYRGWIALHVSGQLARHAAFPRGHRVKHGSAGALSNAAIEAGIVEADPVRRMYEVGDGVGIRRGDGARHGEADSVVPGAAGQGGVQAGDRHVIAGTAIQSVGVRSAGDGVGQRCRSL